MLENLFTNVFGRPKNKSSVRNSQQDPNNTSTTGLQPAGSAQMTGPFSSSMPQMPQPSTLPYPPAAPYSSHNIGPTPTPSTYYPSLPFSQPPPLPGGYGAHHGPPDGNPRPHHYPTGTLSSNVSPLDSVPFEARLTLNNSTNLVSLDQLFKEIKKSAEVVDRVDAYLRSNQSDYDFKTELGLMH